MAYEAVSQGAQLGDPVRSRVVHVDQALERVFLAVNTPPVKLPPGSWVRISGWMKVSGGVRASADGAMFFDTAAGEAYAVRATDNLEWKHFHLYRKVPASGDVIIGTTTFGHIPAFHFMTDQSPRAVARAAPHSPPMSA